MSKTQAALKLVDTSSPANDRPPIEATWRQSLDVKLQHSQHTGAALFGIDAQYTSSGPFDGWSDTLVRAPILAALAEVLRGTECQRYLAVRAQADAAAREQALAAARGDELRARRRGLALQSPPPPNLADELLELDAQLAELPAVQLASASRAKVLQAVVSDARQEALRVLSTANSSARGAVRQTLAAEHESAWDALLAAAAPCLTALAALKCAEQFEWNLLPSVAHLEALVDRGTVEPR